MTAYAIVRFENRDLVALRQKPCSGKTGDARADNCNSQGPVGLGKMAHDDPFAAIELIEAVRILYERGLLTDHCKATISRSVIRCEKRHVEEGMNDVSTPIEIDREPGMPTGRRLAVVSSREMQQTPSPDALVDMMMQIAQGRDRQAFALLFRYFGPRLKTFFLRWKLPSGAAEDLVQETMLTVWRKASYFDPARAGVATWVFTIARNIRIDYMRRQRDPSTLPPDPEDGPDTLEDGLLGAERDAQVRQALTALSPEQQTIVRLAYFSEKSQTEIADELGIPLGTVKSRTRLAMNRLRALLEDKP